MKKLFKILGITIGIVLFIFILGIFTLNFVDTDDYIKPAFNENYWINAGIEIYISISQILDQHKKEIDSGIYYKKLVRGNTDLKEIAITFDDGPHEGTTHEILEILKEKNVKATFFVIGKMAEKYPDLIAQEFKEGHCIGNHTYHHVNMTKVPLDYIAIEIKACGDIVKSITGIRPNTFRPPGGQYNKDVAEIANMLGYTLILWNDDPGDYASPGNDVIKERILKYIRNGTIILIHDGTRQTIDILPDLIDEIKKRGYKFITVEEMLREEPNQIAIKRKNVIITQRIREMLISIRNLISFNRKQMNY